MFYISLKCLKEYRSCWKQDVCQSQSFSEVNGYYVMPSHQENPSLPFEFHTFAWHIVEKRRKEDYSMYQNKIKATHYSSLNTAAKLETKASLPNN